MSFEKKLQNLRKKAGLSQEELASQLGVSRQAVSKWESGSSYPEMDKLILMTKLFKCTLDDLVNDDIKEIETNNKSKKVQNTKDSLLEFITKSISMFTSMKSSSALKCLVEIAVFIFGLVIVTAIIFEIGVGILDSMFSAVYPLTLFLVNVYLIVLIALDLIIIFQFYKIRYLDYYDEIVYQQSIKNDIVKNTITKNDEKTNENLKDGEKEDKKNQRINLSHKDKERIIIRDPEHRPLAFLSTISDVIIFIYKCVLRFITVPFLFLLVFLVIGLVILIYLVSYNAVFIGASIACAAAILLNVLVIRTLSDDLFKGKYPIKIMSILFLVSLVFGGIGAGLSIISCKNIDFREADTLTKVSEVYDYNDKLYLNFMGATDGMIVFEEDDTLDNVLITFEYDSRIFKYELSNPAGDESYLLLNRMMVDDYSSKQLIDEFLNNLKKNLVLSYGLYGGTPVVKIKANEKHIKKLISNISEKNDINVEERNINGITRYRVYSIDTDTHDIKACYQDDYYKKCFRIVDETGENDFTYEIKNNEFVYNKARFNCYKNEEGYYCSDNN